VNHVVEDHELAASAETFAKRPTANLARTNAAIKELLSQWRNKGHRHAKDALYDISIPLFDAPDVQARLVAAAEGMRKTSK
jgi:enoyl-CoA hydratase/carnithine racemase